MSADLEAALERAKAGWHLSTLRCKEKEFLAVFGIGLSHIGHTMIYATSPDEAIEACRLKYALPVDCPISVCRQSNIP